MKANNPVILAILHEHTDGLTIKQLVELIPATHGADQHSHEKHA